MDKEIRVQRKKPINHNKIEARRLFIEEKMSVKEILKRFSNFHKVTVKEKWLGDLLRIDREQKMQEESELILSYYLEELEKGNNPLIKDMAKRFDHCEEYIAKIIKKHIPRAPENGIYEVKTNGKVERFFATWILEDILEQDKDYIARRLKDKKVPRRRLLTAEGKIVYFYPLNAAIKIFPSFNNLLARIDKLRKNRILRYKPREMGENEFLVLISIIAFQEENYRKPTRKALVNILKLYHIKERAIEQILDKLKKTDFIKEKNQFFAIVKGPRDLILQKGICYDPDTWGMKKIYHPRPFTDRNWQLIEDRSGLPKKDPIIINILEALSQDSV